MGVEIKCGTKGVSTENIWVQVVIPTSTYKYLINLDLSCVSTCLTCVTWICN